jgi:GT2 family glycosyltransferase
VRSVILAPIAPITSMAAIDLIRDELSRYRSQEVGQVGLEVELGGAFPALDHSVIQTWNNTDDPAALLSQPCTFLRGDWLHLDTYHLTLFLDALREHTALTSVGCRLRGCGRFRLIVKAVSRHGEHVLREAVVEGGRSLSTFEANDRDTAMATLDEWERQGNLADLQGPWVDVKVMKAGYRLTASVECLSDVGVLSGFRWLGRPGNRRLNLGQRVYLFRTFGNPDLVAKSLNLLRQRVGNDNHWKSFVKRSLFIVYDATGKDQADLFSPAAAGLRVLYTQGGNYGGGGNASFLVEMLRRAGEGLNTIDEVVIIDDDAGIDPETILRHDGYVSLRRDKVFASSIVFARENPLCIQEWGGYWGQFFSELSDRPVQPSIPKNQHKLYPYLVRHGQNIKEPSHLNNLSQALEVDFSTFIFISFPFAALNSIGGLLPVFLRNDDVDLSLRLKQQGYKLAINSNLFAYHDSGHSLNSEFFANLHGLIVNSAYFGLSLESIQRYFSRRIGAALSTRNLLLLKAYDQVLKVFNQGPDFMAPRDAYGRYKQVMATLGGLQRKVLRPIPDEIVEELRTKNLVDVRTLLDPLPPAPSSLRGDVVFADQTRNGYFSMDSEIVSEEITSTTSSLYASMASLSGHFDAITSGWKNWVHSFNSYEFWNQESEAFRIANESMQSRHELAQISQLSSNNDTTAAETGVMTYKLRGLHRDRLLAEIMPKDLAISEPPHAPAPSTPSVPPTIEATSSRRATGRKRGLLRQLMALGSDSKQSSAPADVVPSDINLQQLPYGFSPERYLSLNPDVKASGVNAVTHYLRHGRFEQRQY